MSTERCTRCGLPLTAHPSECPFDYDPNPARPVQADYVVAFFDPTSYTAPRGPKQVHVVKGDSTKDTQDKVASLAEQLPHVIYFVVLEQDFRQYYRDILDHYLGRTA